MTLRPFFSFYGSKWRLGPKYPEPKYGTIIEPFAGSAGYSLRYPEREIVLVDKDPIICAIWRWLIAAGPDDIFSLPTLKRGESLDSYDLPQEAKWLMGLWIDQAQWYPCKTATLFADYGHGRRNACDMYKARIVHQLGSIRHWIITEADYTEMPNRAATWFIDPPYQVAGHKYRYGPKQLDYESLGSWCRSRSGQVIVCENVGASWLPFESFSEQFGVPFKGKRHISKEAVWLNETT